MRQHWGLEQSRELPAWVSATAVVGTFVALTWLERRRPLRTPAYEPKGQVWDALHRTLREDVPQDRITIGVDDLREPDEVTLPKLVAMPFTREASARSQITHG